MPIQPIHTVITSGSYCCAKKTVPQQQAGARSLTGPCSQPDADLTGSAIATAAPTCVEMPDHRVEKPRIDSPRMAPVILFSLYVNVCQLPGAREARVALFMQLISPGVTAPGWHLVKTFSS